MDEQTHKPVNSRKIFINKILRKGEVPLLVIMGLDDFAPEEIDDIIATLVSVNAQTMYFRIQELNELNLCPIER